MSTNPPDPQMSQSLPELTDPLAVAGALIRCPSITPHEGGALHLLEALLTKLGFVCERMRFEDETSPPVDNLYARRGSSAPHFCFAGHTDVVPIGEEKMWATPPFSGQVRNGELLGRGAADMKGAIGAFVAAVARASIPSTGSISLLITGDEEGPAVNGTQKMLRALQARGEHIDHCLVGEPTSKMQVGDTLKIGRRGSLNAVFTVEGQGGHVAYPHLANNPLPALVELLARLTREPLDQGNDHFDPSSLQVTSIDVGNEATNVIPSSGRARVNIRFNDLHSTESLKLWLQTNAEEIAQEYKVAVDLAVVVSGTAFVTEPGAFTDMVASAIHAVNGLTPEFSTSGGTSDARFIKDYCAVAELGLVGHTMHKVDERVPADDVEVLAKIYEKILRAYFSSPPL